MIVACITEKPHKLIARDLIDFDVLEDVPSSFVKVDALESFPTDGFGEMPIKDVYASN